MSICFVERGQKGLTSQPVYHAERRSLVTTKIPKLGGRFDDALVYATHAHAGQVRKGTSTPYIAHLLAVAATVLEYGGDEDLAIAALLHDCVEDQGGKDRLEEVRKKFGDRVAKVVKNCSDSIADTTKGEKKLPSLERKKQYLKHLQTADNDALRVSLADKIHNARSILRDLRTPAIGEGVFDRFSVPRDTTLWYYRSLADIFCARLPGQLSNELSEIIDAIEADDASQGSV
jgi:(p)ppGpp synthase/HD superfamily hydrolase